MKTAVAACILFWVTGLALLYHSTHMPKTLPHRAVNSLTNWGQGRQGSTNACPPGTVRFETDDGLFLECFRATQN